MNTLPAIIKVIQSHQTLSLVTVQIHDILIKSILLENSDTAPYLKTNHAVNILFKETEVIISKEKKLPISLQNKIPCQLTTMERGELLTRLTLQFYNYTITSVITTHAVKELGLKEGDDVCAWIKTNEIMLAP